MIFEKGNKMVKNINTNNEDPLINMLNAATQDDLIELIKELVENDLSIHRICIDNLKEKVTASLSRHDSYKSSSALTLWYEIEPELSELDEYGGGDYRIEQEVRRGFIPTC